MMAKSKVKGHSTDKMEAVLSSCGRYRYHLSREWADKPVLAFIMLNPSTADAAQDDPTIRRCIRFARDSGYGKLLVGNLFAWRATDATEIRRSRAPIGPDNDTALVNMIGRATLVVCAWGNGGTYLERNEKVLALIKAVGKRPHCLKMTKEGHPSHPLYLPTTLRPIELV